MSQAPAPADVAATFCATLVDEWARAGVSHAVVAPGSRGTPVTLALTDEARIRVHVQVDERSAAFIALGLGLATGRPAVVVTTSGTAAVELHPAVVEAHHAGVPLLAVTADRPPELADTGAPQTIDQTRLFGVATRWSIAPGVADPAAADQWRSLGARMVTEATAARPGPVHANLAFREPLVGRPGALPTPRSGGQPWHGPAPSTAVAEPARVAALAARLAEPRGVLIAGGGAPGARSLELGRRLGWPVLADPRCGASGPGVAHHADAIVRDRDVAGALAPDIAVRLGDPPASRAIDAWLAEAGTEQWLVGRRWADAHRVARGVLLADPDRVLVALGEHLGGGDQNPPAGDGWLTTWTRAQRAAATAVDGVLADAAGPTEPGTARAALAATPAGGSLVVASSMPVRDLEWFAEPRRDVAVLANRGANGIDGVVSTAVGVALTGRPTVALVGDLAFLHDSNALIGLTGRGVDLCVVVVDNDGGGIFSFLAQHEELAPGRFERLFATPHDADLSALARAHGLRVHEVGADDAAGTGDAGGDVAVAEAVSAAVAAGGPAVVRVRTDRETNRGLHDHLNAAVAEAVRGALGLGGTAGVTGGRSR